MKRNMSRVFAGVGFGCLALLACAGWLIAIRTHASLTNNNSFSIRDPLSIGNPFSIGVSLGLLLALLFSAVALVGAIVRLGQLRQWGWFVTLLALTAVIPPLGIICFVLYLLVGPTSEASATSLQEMHNA